MGNQKSYPSGTAYPQAAVFLIRKNNGHREAQGNSIVFMYTSKVPCNSDEC